MDDIVYFLKTPLPNEELELKYSLRSLKNIPHGKVFMVTPTLPDIVDPDRVEHVSDLPVGETKYDDLSIKWKWLGTNTVMTDHVIYMDDDYYIIKPVPRPRAHKLGFHPLWAIIDLYKHKEKTNLGGNTDVLDANINTMRLLQERGVKKPNSPQQHFPWPVERSNIPIHWEDGNGPYDWKILEFNHNNRHPPMYAYECKASNRAGLSKVIKRGGAYLSSNEGITLYTSGILTFLSAKFPERSVYERD